MWITITPSGGEGAASLAFSELSKFSKIALERSEPGYTWEVMRYEGNRLVFVTTIFFPLGIYILNFFFLMIQIHFNTK